MYVFVYCRNEFLSIINVYVENNPTVRGLIRTAFKIRSESVDTSKLDHTIIIDKRRSKQELGALLTVHSFIVFRSILNTAPNFCLDFLSICTGYVIVKPEGEGTLCNS